MVAAGRVGAAKAQVEMAQVAVAGKAQARG